MGLAGSLLAIPPAQAEIVPRQLGEEPALSYLNYPAPAGLADNAGEPSIGWTGASDAIMFQANVQTSEVHWNDTFREPVASWTPHDSLITSNTASFDPILATDPATGRTFVSQLALACSGASFTDDDGKNWQPSSGCPAPHGADHQTVGYGPAVPGSPEAAVARQGRMAYYCSQEIVTALCGASLDGGQTFGPSSPAFTAANCGNSFHGHVKVGPDGSVYLPSERCSGQAIARSFDNGRTFDFKKLPADFTAVSNLTHPSISVSRAAPKPSTATGPGVLYYANGDAQNRLIVTASADRGTTWGPRVDITAGLGLKAVDFPVVQAGDPDRAAVAFFGTKDVAGNGNYSTVGYGEVAGRHTVAWHLYIAHTYDRGLTWTVVDATPDDPTQRGCLWTSGTTVDDAQSACRNLLDFNGIAIDGIGRVLVGWADGCTGPCRTSDAVVANDRSQLGTITRQTSGRGLYAVDDGAIKPGTNTGTALDPCASGPQVLDEGGDAVDLLGNETPLPNEPQLDLRSMELTTQSNDTVRFTLTVEDLKSALEVPSGSPGGVYYEMLFTYGGLDMYINVTRDAKGVGTFSLGTFAPTRKTLATLSGTFDEVAETITSEITPALMENARANITAYNAVPTNTTKIAMVPPLKAGATFTSLKAQSRRNVIAVVPDIDAASGSCIFTLGAPTAVVPEVPLPILLLLSAALVGGATVEIGRRRRRGIAA